jgi:alkanesulfonate monooxygenase SsuD/methylene tetrahydromethanopterin reductase-like flavin-dependent oxidoreductase (luciferase family)
MERLVVAGTPEGVVRRVRSLLEVGFQYVMFFLPTVDWESMELSARRVIPSLASPAIVAGQTA